MSLTRGWKRPPNSKKPTEYIPAARSKRGFKLNDPHPRVSPVRVLVCEGKLTPLGRQYIAEGKQVFRPSRSNPRSRTMGLAC